MRHLAQEKLDLSIDHIIKPCMNNHKQYQTFTLLNLSPEEASGANISKY